MKKKGTFRIILLILIMFLIFTETAIVTASKVKEKRIAAAQSGPDTIAGLDIKSMHEYSMKNSEKVFEALGSGNSKKLKKLMTDSSDLDTVMDFADWSTADFGNAVSMGSGSMSASPDEDGRMDVGERFFVDAGDSKYVFYIETMTSKNGRNNDGVSAIGVTTYEHFDAGNYEWNGEKDDQSALAGELYWYAREGAE